MRRILVLGVARGGTTWVGQALGATAGSVYAHEPDGVHDPFAYRARLHLPLVHHNVVLEPGTEASDYARLWDGAFVGGAPSRTFLDRLARRAFTGVPPRDRFDAREGRRVTPRLRVALLAARPRVAVAGAGQVVVKSVHAATAVEWLAQRYAPEVVVVHRNPLNVVASWLDLGWRPPSERAYADVVRYASGRWGVDLPAGEPSPVARLTAGVAVLMLRLREALRAHAGWHEVTHEDLCDEPLLRLRALAGALDLDWTDAAERYVVESNREGTGLVTRRAAERLPERWRDSLDAGQVAEVVATLERFPEALWRSPAAGRAW